MFPFHVRSSTYLLISERFEDISLNQVSIITSRCDKILTETFRQWLALTPPDLVKAHLGLSDDTISHLQKTKPTVNGPAA